MEIKVGEYIRTIDGYIRKVTQVNEKGTYQARAFGKYETDVDYKNSKCISEKKITKHSSNIIDLIEVGDIIKVKELDGVREVIEDDFFDKDMFDNDARAILDDTFYESYSKQIRDYKIISVVTHEQFKEMEYKL